MKRAFQASRRLVQSLSLLLLHSSWGPDAKWLCNPVLSCHSCVLSWFACPIGVFVNCAGLRVVPFFAIGALLLIGILFGRLLCGWVCPFGLLQDVLHRIPSPKFALPRWTRSLKYAVLLLLVLLFPLLWGADTPYSFCRICPASAIQVTLPGMITGSLASPGAGTILKLAILVAVLLLVVFSSRAFCNAFCPIGALLAPLNLLSFWTVRVPPRTCTSCQRCDRSCPTDVSPSARILKGRPANRALDCIVCHDCQAACRTTPALEG